MGLSDKKLTLIPLKRSIEGIGIDDEDKKDMQAICTRVLFADDRGLKDICDIGMGRFSVLLVLFVFLFFFFMIY